MATIQENLAKSLTELKNIQNEGGNNIIKSSSLSRVHITRLIASGFLQEVIKGWYIITRPDTLPGDTTNWYTNYWYFISTYAESKFNKDWCLTAEQSLNIYSGSKSVPNQVIIRSPKSSNNIIQLLHSTSLMDIKASIANTISVETQFGLNLYSLPEALIECSPDFYKSNNIAIRTCLSLIPDALDILKILLEKGQSSKAGRIAGAFRNIGNASIANEITNTFKRFGYDIREVDPFSSSATISYLRASSPYVTRLKLMWQSMRETVINNYPQSTRKHTDIEKCMKQIDEQYQLDSYNSLSIEGYKVTEELIIKVKEGLWKPDENASDFEQKNALAARGYWQAFQAVKNSINRILQGEDAEKIVENEHNLWYNELFMPSVTIGLLKISDLIGYRNHQVYIKGSMHTPLRPDAIRDAMSTLFELISMEPNYSVKAILGHFFFVYIHPYMDGNGRIARFLMNTLFISGGYNWTIIPIEKRNEYMSALEKASIKEDILEFVIFIASLKIDDKN